MSFSRLKRTIELGDTVILYLSVNSMFPLRVEPLVKNKNGNFVDHVFQTTYGALRVAELIGKKFGCKVQLSRGWGFILYPSCDLWTLCLPHRTQIIYSPDISLILCQLNLRPGSRVIEAGTGSGSLSHAILRVVKPTGSLITFDFHAERVLKAQEEFLNHGYDAPTVQGIHRDVCKLGFEIENESSSSKLLADAVFLDLPHPWLAIPHARKVLTKGGRIATFSPCIEQVQKSREALLASGFFEVETMEGLSRELQVQYRTHPKISLIGESVKDQNKYLTSLPAATLPGHTGFLTFATLKP